MTYYCRTKEIFQQMLDDLLPAMEVFTVCGLIGDDKRPILLVNAKTFEENDTFDDVITFKDEEAEQLYMF